MTTSRILLAVLFTLATLAGASACSKDEPPPPPAPSAAVSVAPPLPSVAPSVAPSAAPSAVPSDSASATPSPSTSSSARPAATCGDKPLPACPLAAWMKKNTSPAMTAQDFGALATALEKIVAFAPTGVTPPYTNWVSISRDGADAARAQSLDGVKASCRGCHNQYKDRYRKEMRDRPIGT
jgi:hypothetical protein